MAGTPLTELKREYQNFKAVSDECARTADYNGFADLFTEDCTYIEHVFGEMHGREAVRQWIVPIMMEYPNDQMTYTHEWCSSTKRKDGSSSARGRTCAIFANGAVARR